MAMPVHFSGADVLIIDNDVVFASQLCVALRHYGILAEVATDGFTGMTAAAEMRPRVILIDLLMPVIGGVEVGQYVETVSPESKVLFMSGDFDAMRDAKQRLVGEPTIVDKPIPLPSLVRYVRGALQ